MLEFIKTRNVKSPERNALENAGIDFYIPEKNSYTEEELKTFGSGVSIVDNHINIAPHKDVKIPAGIKSKFPNNIALIAYNKSGIATKKKLIFGAEIIDSSYHGEIHFHLINWSDETQIIEFGQKILQFVPTVISNEELVVRHCSEEEFFTVHSNRGNGGFGSTGV